MSVPTKQSYEEALKVKEQYEKRQQELQYIKDQLGAKLQQFTQVKFRVNKSRKEITFAGVINGQLKLTTSRCASGDKFELDLGKLIAVKKALKEDLEDVVKLVEKENNIIINTNGMIINNYPYGVLSVNNVL